MKKRNILISIGCLLALLAIAGAASRTPLLRAYLQSSMDGNQLSGTNFATLTVNADPYDATWDGSLKVPTQDDLYDQIQSIVLSGGGTLSNTAALTDGRVLLGGGDGTVRISTVTTQEIGQLTGVAGPVGTIAQITSATQTLSGRTLTVAGTANQITSSAGAQDLTANRTWTLSLPTTLTIPGSLTTPSNINMGPWVIFTNATSFTVSNTVTDEKFIFSTNGSFITDQADITTAYVTNVIFSLPGTDNTAAALGIAAGNAGENVTQWDAVRRNSDGTWHQADANAAGEFPCRGLAAATITSGNALTVITYGPARNDAWNWTVGATIWLSATAGGLTQTQPSTTGDAIQAVGYALSADVMWVQPSMDWGISP